MGPYPGALPPAPAPSIWTRGHAISARVVTVLAICWFLVEAWFAFASSTMFEKYQFAALASPARDIYRVSSFCIVCIALCGIGSTTTANTKVMKLLLGVLVVGNVSAYIATRSRMSHGPWFADAFNDFFCTTRTLQVCIEGDDLQLLELTRGEASGNVNVTSNGNAVFIWRRCRDVLVESNTELVETSWGAFQPSDLGLVSDAHRAFLADCTVTDANDSWCGNQYLATHTKTPATAAANSGESVNHPGSISPFDANPRMFARFVSEWKTRMMYDNVLLGSILAFLLIQAVCERRLHLALGFQMIP